MVGSHVAMRCRLLGNSKHVLRWVVLFNDILLYASDFSIGIYTYFAPPHAHARHSARRKEARRESRRRRAVNLSCIADRSRVANADGAWCVVAGAWLVVV